MTRTKIGIIFGGRSEEHPVSIKSAREVAASLDPERYEPYWVGVRRGGAWKLCDGPDADLDDDGLPTVVLSSDPMRRGFVVLDGSRQARPTGTARPADAARPAGCIELDVVFPVLHGRWGEDGAVQGLLELSGIPYIGCDVSASALAFDKALSYLVAQAAGVAIPNFSTVTASDHVDAASFTYPVFVKPARSGSSFGVTKVARADELFAAIRTAQRFDSKVLIEEAVVGSEIGCAVLGNDAELTLGELDRVALSDGFFRIHQEADPESGSENSTFIVPADISAEVAARVRDAATTIYRALGCRGLARVDLFLTEDGTVVLNEVNTLPGLTSYSRYPRMMAAAGLSLAGVIDRLVSLAR